MTLATEVFLSGDIDGREVFAYAQHLLALYDKQKRPASEQKTRAFEGPDSEGVAQLSNRIGQGLPAILDVKFRTDGSPLRAEDIPETEGSDWEYPKCSVEVRFDTGYGYSDSLGGCSHLHARFICALQDWVTERDGSLAWRNEYTGDVHQGLDGISEFIGDGNKAADWFATEALPAIVADIAQRSKATNL